MKRFTLFILCACACTFLSANNDTIRILGIGNSFTMDAMEAHLQPIMSSMHQPATMAYPYRGGTTLKQHDSWKNRTDTMPYNYYEWYQEELLVGGDRSAHLTMAVEKRPWDYVVIQTDHAQSGVIKSYDPYLTNIISFVKTHCSNPNVKIGLYMTWAYDSVSTYEGFARYQYDTQIMYDSIINAVKAVMNQHQGKDIDFLIPVGTAVQNARTSFKGHTLTRDGYHLNYDYGRYISSLAWASVICGFDPDSVPYYPVEISEYCANMCRAAVKGALTLPYDTTSLRKDFGKSESGSDASDESRLERVTFNGLSVPIVEGQTEYTVKINASLNGKVSMYSFPMNRKCEQNITNEQGADIPRDPKQYGYFPLDAPELDQTVTYTNRVIAEDLKHVTTYTFHLVGASEKDLVYTISSLDDLKDFATAVNGGQYGLNAELVHDVNLDLQKQACWKTPIGTIEHPYTGTFDGKGYALDNFNIYSNGDTTLWNMTSLGLFGAIKNATIKNLTLTTRTNGASVDECYFMKPGTGQTTHLEACGVLVGWMAHSTISRCKLNVHVYTTMKCPTGALVGLENGSAGRSVIDRCEVSGIWRARQTNYYAAYVGQANNVAITNSSSHVRMPLETDHGAHIAGFVGLAQSSESGRMVTIQNCYFAGYIQDDRAAKGAATTNTPYLASFISYAKSANTFMDNCYYLQGSAPKVVAAYKDHPIELTATEFTEANLTDSTLIPLLGGAFEQGEKYPVIKEPEPGLVERFSKYADNSWSQSAGTEMVKNGDVCDWKVFHSRRNTSKEILACGQYATWFAKTSDGYIQTASAIEGGVKEISFLWNKYETDTADIKVAVTVDTITDSTEQLQVPGNPRQNFDYEYIHHFGVKKNAPIKIFNPGNKVIHVGNISITPYLRYTNKEVTVDAYKYQALDYKYTNPDLINNTDEDTVIYTLSGKNAAAIASIDSLTGEVTMLSDGTVTVRAAWHEVVTTYTLIIQMSLPTTALVEQFSKVEQTKCNETESTWEGDIANWQAFHVRRAAKDTLNGGLQATWMKINGYLSANLEGGIKHLKFDWREFVDTVAELSVGVFIDSVWTDTARMQTSGSFPTSINETYDMEVGYRQNGTLSFRNLATNARADRFLLGDVYITPYIFFPFNKRSLSFDQSAVQSFDLRSILIDNTWGEGEIVYTMLSDQTEGATIAGSIVDFSQSAKSGDIRVQVSWNDSNVVLSPVTLSISVPEAPGEAFTETFSNCTKSSFSGTTYVVGDHSVFGWNFTHFARQYVDSIAGHQGTRIGYNGGVAMNGAQEGGIKRIQFDWRAKSAAQPVHFIVSVDGESYDYTYTIEQSKGEVHTYEKAFDITSNTAMSVTVGAKESTPQSEIVVGPIAITPYLLFRTKRDTVVLSDTTAYSLDSVLINNTKDSVVYSILSDETGAASIHNGVLDVSAVTKNGNIKVQATWNAVSTTISIYALYVVTDLKSQFSSSPSPRFTKIFRDGQLYILRDGKTYSPQGLRL